MKYSEENVEIGIIGGTGSDLELEDAEEVKVYTPYGSTSDLINVGFYKGKKIAFLPRHGPGHAIPLNNLNARANIWALAKELGVKRIISPSAVGSLVKEYDKGDFVIIDQYIDRTKKRLDTFYEGGQVCHMSQAEPFCPEMNEIFYNAGKEIPGLNITLGGTYVCIEGPRFSTIAESRMFRKWDAQIIGMTCYPEVVLAAEAEVCYSTISMVIDLDVWAAECEHCGIVEIGPVCPSCGNPIKKYSVSIKEILETMEKNAKNLKTILDIAIPKIPKDRICKCKDSIQGAII